MINCLLLTAVLSPSASLSLSVYTRTSFHLTLSLRSRTLPWNQNWPFSDLDTVTPVCRDRTCHFRDTSCSTCCPARHCWKASFVVQFFMPQSLTSFWSWPLFTLAGHCFRGHTLLTILASLVMLQSSICCPFFYSPVLDLLPTLTLWNLFTMAGHAVSQMHLFIFLPSLVVLKSFVCFQVFFFPSIHDHTTLNQWPQFTLARHAVSQTHLVQHAVQSGTSEKFFLLSCSPFSNP